MNIPVTILILAAASAVAFGQLTREQAVNALIDPGSGVPIDPAESQVWSPFVDFGSGAGFEGLLPQNSDVSPAQAGLPPFPGPGMPVNVDSYFFWIDDAPSARFQHETRFVLVHAGLATPTVGNGGIIVTAQGWWPVVTEAGGAVGAYFATAESRTTAAPVGFANPDGLVFGFATPPPPAPAPPPPGTPGGGTSTACGLIIRGSEGADFATDTQRFEKDLKEVHGLPDGRIVKANGGAAATAADIDAALTALCNISGCTKIYVRIVSHGSEGSLTLAGDTSISAADLCQKLQNIANKGVPICLLIDACHSSSLKDPNNWNFPAGSVIMTSSAASEISFGHVTPYTMPDGTSVSGGLYGASFSRCLRDRRADTDRDRQVEDNEAHNWVVSRQECWTW
ncbi:MAG: hypothetical protein HKO57_04125, partial [Akkermansiaceae bacterium]|nr:hypothetical protein [Akkermansiaceae bacterium]